MKKIVPVLLGADLNAYSMAMSFADAYGVQSYVLARDKLAITSSSRFVRYGVVEGLDGREKALTALIELANRHEGDRLILVPCADWYTEMTENARDELRGRYFFNLPTFGVWKRVSDKASFAELLSEYGIAHPRTVILQKSSDAVSAASKELRPPFVIKPADSTEYWRHPFVKMRKTYFAYTLSEAREIAKMIFESGYGGKVILQQFFGDSVTRGADASVLTTYSDISGRVIRAVLGDVLLEDRSPTATGNYSAIVTRELDGISHSLINMLNSIGYTGIANFDILRQGSKRVCLELNARQGRSFDYVRMAGVNLARLLVGDMNGEKRKCRLEYSDGVWSSVPWRTVRAFAPNKELLARAELLRRGGLLFSPYRHKLKESIGREAFVAVHLFREAKKFKREIRGTKSVAE